MFLVLSGLIIGRDFAECEYRTILAMYYDRKKLCMDIEVQLNSQEGSGKRLLELQEALNGGHVPETIANDLDMISQRLARVRNLGEEFLGVELSSHVKELAERLGLDEKNQTTYIS